MISLSPGNTSGPAGRKVLVIDDEKPTLNMFAMFLDAYGYEYLSAESGETGLEIFSREKPEIVFTDVRMPGMDGMEVLQKIKQITPQTEVIVITGYGDMDLAIRALNADAADFINKPVKRAELERALSMAGKRLDLSSTRKETVELHIEADTARVGINGQLNAFAEPYLAEACQRTLEQQCTRLVLDFSGQGSMNGAGIKALARVIETCSRNNTEVSISGLAANFKKVLEKLGLLEKVKIMP